MPTRTIVQDLCDVCFAEQNGKDVAATDRLQLALQDRDFLLVCEKHIGPIRDELQRLSELATPEGRKPRTSSSDHSRVHVS